MHRLYLFCVLSFIAIACFAKNLSPIDYGFYSASSDLDRFWVLLRVHTDAVKRGYGVTYKGIKQICIEIPKTGQSIPLPHYTDFAGARIKVRNQIKNIPLFYITQKLKEINISKEDLFRGSFIVYPELRRGNVLLIIEDQEKWVSQRRGYSYGAIRKDILFLKKGKAKNQTISTYNDEVSKPKFYWCRTSEKIVLKNLVYERTSDSDKITYLCSIENKNDILIKKVKIITPNNTGLYADCAIKLENCTNVKLEDVEIAGTYSLPDKYGYGIGMNNVWNSSFTRLKADGEWGIFGNNNINYAVVKDSEINRFDIHCYGRDVICQNTVFRNLYNQFSSLYGTLRFDKCKFINFIPVLFEYSYSAYSFFNLEFTDSYIEVSKDRPYLILAGKPTQLAELPRHEFSKVSWPDIKIKDLMVVLPKGIKKWTIFQNIGDEGAMIYELSNIIINGLNVVSDDKEPLVSLTNKKVDFDNYLNIQLSNSNISDIIRKE